MNITKTPNSISLDISEMADKPKHEKTDIIANRALKEFKDEMHKRFFVKGTEKIAEFEEKQERTLKMFKTCIVNLLSNSDVNFLKVELKEKDSRNYFDFNVLSESEFNNEILGKVNITYRASSARPNTMQLA